MVFLGDAGHAIGDPAKDDDALCGGDLSALFQRDAQGRAA